VTQYVNPWKLWHGAFVPEWLMRRPSSDVPPGSKLLYARLCRYAGKSGRKAGIAFPPMVELAAECGMSSRQASRYLVHLETKGLLEVQRRPNRSNLYRFPAHEWMGFGEDACDRSRSDASDSRTETHASEPSSPSESHRVAESPAAARFLNAQKGDAA